ncbi:UNVERIFIED_ORG: putative damage-inducible protein DinB [Pseudomonas lini]|uniref:Damage-inducible protein DinB n=1 Tax=Pseudomonas viciae TaxID=2505979 RepID=A0A4P7PGE3_9PSED|nr:DinB family protein [Pseudomonas viciae]QBZ89778.1 damage-inducible protein DinB [Pseudomonas viciae]UZE89238.1 DinB family protein [Pseudomonas viciae]WGO96055.1 DinB family protein [Pseudomonas viciae]
MNYFLAQALNNQWANHRLLTACAQLSEAEYLAERTSFFPSIQSTLCHILEVDRYYLTALEGDRDGQNKDFSETLTFPRLRESQTQTDQRLVALCEALRENDLARSVDLVRADGVVRERIDRLLLHLFEHQIHHRGQVHTLLSATPVKPPQLDEFFLECDRRFRVDEEQRLQLDERRVWREYLRG